jgi:hypothetical protein
MVALLLVAWVLGLAAFGALGLWAYGRPLGHLHAPRVARVGRASSLPTVAALIVLLAIGLSACAAPAEGDHAAPPTQKEGDGARPTQGEKNAPDVPPGGC